MTRRAPGPAPWHAVVAVLALALPAGALSACATTIDTSATTPASTPPPTPSLAVTGSTDERLAALASEVGALSERLVDNEGQTEALARIEAHWAAVRPEIDTQRPELLAGFDAAIGQIRRSVERRRPADADKASKNLDVLITALRR